METKICKCCNIEKDIDLFYKKTRNKDGLDIYCKTCSKDKVKKYNHSEKGRIRAVKYKSSKQRKEVLLRHSKTKSFKDAQKKYRNSDKGKEFELKFKKANKYKMKARSVLNRMVKNGLIIKPTKCEICFVKSDKLEGHHEDYSKCLDVIWCCKECHTGIHYNKLDNNKKKVYNDIVNKMKGKEK